MSALVRWRAIIPPLSLLLCLPTLTAWGQGMIRQVDGSGAGQPGIDAAAAVRDREPGNR